MLQQAPIAEDGVQELDDQSAVDAKSSDGSTNKNTQISVSIEEISKVTAINVNDLASAMQWCNMFARSSPSDK